MDENKSTLCAGDIVITQNEYRTLFVYRVTPGAGLGTWRAAEWRCELVAMSNTMDRVRYLQSWGRDKNEYVEARAFTQKKLIKLGASFARSEMLRVAVVVDDAARVFLRRPYSALSECQI